MCKEISLQNYAMLTMAINAMNNSAMLRNELGKFSDDKLNG